MTSALATEWREVGGLGRLGAIGLLLSSVVAVVLGLWIEGAVHQHLLDVRVELIQQVAEGLAADGLLPPDPAAAGTGPNAALDAAIEHRLIGGDIVGAAILDASGTTVYDGLDDVDSTPPAVRGELPHVEQHGDGLLHFFVPIEVRSEGFAGSLEVFQKAASFDEVLARVRRNVWLAISMGLGSLGIAMGAFTLGHARVLDRRRRHAERLLGELLHVEDQERHRIVAALHDDIGQPLYRLLYGLEGCRARVSGDPQVARELQRLTGLVRDVDRTLRAELHQLHRSSLDNLDLGSALRALADECRAECQLAVDVAIDVDPQPSSTVRSVLLRAVQEGLLNVRKHAGASTVTIDARGDDRQVCIQVIDDGRGVAGPRGLGLTTAAQRLEAIGGRLTVGRGHLGGTVFRVWVPLGQEGV